MAPGTGADGLFGYLIQQPPHMFHLTRQENSRLDQIQAAMHNFRALIQGALVTSVKLTIASTVTCQPWSAFRSLPATNAIGFEAEVE